MFILVLDPYNVRLELITDESINAVADVLRSFFRQLDKPLIPEDLHKKFFDIGKQYLHFCYT